MGLPDAHRSASPTSEIILLPGMIPFPAGILANVFDLFARHFYLHFDGVHYETQETYLPQGFQA